MTDRLQAILAYVTGYWLEWGYGPSLHDIMTACGISSTSAARYSVDRLCDLGHLCRGVADTSISRTIRPATYGEHWKEGRYQP